MEGRGAGVGSDEEAKHRNCRQDATHMPLRKETNTHHQTNGNERQRCPHPAPCSHVQAGGFSLGKAKTKGCGVTVAFPLLFYLLRTCHSRKLYPTPGPPFDHCSRVRDSLDPRSEQHVPAARRAVRYRRISLDSCGVICPILTSREDTSDWYVARQEQSSCMAEEDKDLPREALYEVEAPYSLICAPRDAQY